MNDRIKVLLSTEGTYPFHQGGVSTWCETLVNHLELIDYVVYSVVMNPFVTQKFKLPKNVKLQTVPLWGTEEPSEHLVDPFSHIYLMKNGTTETSVRQHFLPLFTDLITEIIAEHKNPFKLGYTLLGLYDYFHEFEYKVSFKSEFTWNLYKEIILKAVSDKGNKLSQPDLYGLLQSLGWIYRFLNILNTPVPKTHVTHSAAAAFCGIPCVLAKLKNKTPFMLTEHGVYLREQYLSLSKNGYSPFLNTFLIRMVQSITSLNYAYADQVSPVCEYNTRWEKRFGVPLERIRVIYNGVSKHLFSEASNLPQNQPTVVMVSRIDPIKDIMTFLQSAAIVRTQMPNVKFVVYGSVSVPDYYEQCLALRKQLELDESFMFAGHTYNMAAAYHSGDIIALSSISEAFPYSVVEAMMTGKPVVATDVGGVKEALGDTGFLVKPRDPKQLAEAIIKLVESPHLRSDLGQEARQRALNFFTLNKVLDLHVKSYINLALVSEVKVPRLHNTKLAIKQMFLMEKGYALMDIGFYRQAIEHFRTAIQEEPRSSLTLVLLSEIATAYNRLGEYDLAFLEIEKCEAYLRLQEGSQSVA